jgi:hypothetical protein
MQSLLSMKKCVLLLYLVACWTLMSCSKDKSNESLEIIYQAETNVNDSLIIHDKIGYNDIIGYDTSNYTFLIDSPAIKKIRKYFFPSGGLPFSIEVNSASIYSGTFFPSYSNVLPYGIIIDPEQSLTGNKLTVQIEYGFCHTDNALQDLRNDKRIITVLQKDHKLMKISI